MGGEFALVAPWSMAFVLLRRWKRPSDDIALAVIAAGSAALPSVVKLIVARPRPTLAHLSHLVTLSFPSEHTTQPAALYLTIPIMLSKAFTPGLRGLALVLPVLMPLAGASSPGLLAS